MRELVWIRKMQRLVMAWSQDPQEVREGPSAGPSE